MNTLTTDTPQPITVSVLMTVRNGMPYLPLATKSILSQSFKDFEFIIINDGSNDQTATFLDTLKVDSRVIVIHQEKKGIHYSLNFGLQLCRGKYIARLDADDLAENHRLEFQVKYMERHTSCVLLGTACYIINSHGEKKGIRYQPCFHNQLVKALARSNPFTSSSCMMRRESVFAVAGYRTDLGYCEDYDLWIRLSQIGKIHNLTLPLCSYRLHDSAIKSTYAKRQLLDTLALKRFARRNYKLPRSVTSSLYSLAQYCLLALPKSCLFFLWYKLSVKPLPSPP